MNQNSVDQAPALQTASPATAPALERWSFILMAIGGAMIWVAFSLDDATINWVNGHQNQAFKRVCGTVSHFGDWPFLMAAGLGLICLFVKLRQPQWVRLVCIMMVSSTLAGALANTVRLTTGRTRPNARVEAGWYGPRYHGKWLIGRNKYNSFPSGHTATAVGFLVPLLLLAPEIGAPALLIAVIIAGSRIYLGVHHLSDVAVASVLASAVGFTVSRRWPWKAIPVGGNKE